MLETGRRALRRVTGRVDPLGWGAATTKTLARAATEPRAVAAATARLAWGSVRLPVAAAGTACGLSFGDAVERNPKDKRFADRAWSENAYFFAAQQEHALWVRFADEILAAGRGGGVDDIKARMAIGMIADSLAPSNFLLTNPAALIRAFETGGKSLIRGATLAVDDLRQRKGWPAKVDRSAFKLGEDMAATPGSVVFRNDLIELIQYSPQTDKVHEVPLLASPPWINKYYVMDLAPGRSLMEWAVKHQRTVFMISYRNPDSSMSSLTMDDYLEQGVLAALDVVQEITGAPKVDLVSLCLGGVLASAAACYLAARGEDRVGTLTLLNTMLDYSAPGDLSAFVDSDTIDRLNARMAAKGYLEADDMALAFDLLRPQDLIFRYIPERWLLGQEAPAFDLLAWNVDSTRMPATMHLSYLRRLYGANELARGVFELAGERLDPHEAKNENYVVGAVNDHIVPWHASHAANRLIGGTTRYILSSGGHIAGVVNPPSPKAWFETSEAEIDDPEAWRETTHREKGSWWDDWADWSSERAGRLVPAPTALGSEAYPPLEAAPGRYVREQA